jgi:eukaryotic-like serine/threonine-protein kinase
MNLPAASKTTPAVCPACGLALPPEARPSRCPRCLLRQGLPTQMDMSEATEIPPDPRADRVLPQPGEDFGHYRIIRLLGQGGMGTVFEAEDLESGRRLALKVLGHRINSPEARARFYREGRLAASVNHANSVYVFGTEEIAGIPVIAMELVSGGTLHDRVSHQGPLPVEKAVDAVLQVIAGLESAQQAGILHRDIKPSNCFVEPDQTIKIGDFGLSISTVVRAELEMTETGVFLGTPIFSSPEQLRGDELTVRSDIYSVGVTLYYLLTGRYPFESGDMMRLIASVLEQQPVSPASLRPDLPPELCRVLLKCLQKDPEKRLRNYGELRNALLPFASIAPTPATLGLRFLAYVLDWLVAGLPSSAVVPYAVRVFTDGAVFAQYLLEASLWICYFGILEGLWGASAGKRICGLRVVRPDRAAPGLWRGFLRILVFAGIPRAVWMLGMLAGFSWERIEPRFWMLCVSTASIALMAAFFATARRRNFYAGLHDLASGTRVVLKSASQPRPALPDVQEEFCDAKSLPMIGPYHALTKFSAREKDEVVLGFDPRLLRRVWIRILPAETPPVELALRNLRRSTRLRWLSGKRAEGEAWDAYEVPAGQPFLSLLAAPQQWERVRYWLLDLALELSAADKDGTIPVSLALDQVWITAEGRAKLLDFPAPGSSSAARDSLPRAAANESAPLRFLRQVAVSALEGRPVSADAASTGSARAPMPLHASRFLETPSASLEEFINDLRELINVPARVSRFRRLAVLAGAVIVPVLAVFLSGAAHACTRAVFTAAPDLATLRECLVQHRNLEKQAKSGRSDAEANLQAIETYLAGRYSGLIADEAYWNKLQTRILLTDPLWYKAEKLVGRTPTPTPEQTKESEAKLEEFFGKPPDIAAREAAGRIFCPVVALIAVYGAAVVFVIIPCLIGSLVFRGGALMKLLGIVLVTGRGPIASRGRVALRNMLAWLPFLTLPFTVSLLAPAIGLTASMLLLGSICGILAIASALLPGRGVADRLTGTWLVPR